MFSTIQQAWKAFLYKNKKPQKLLPSLFQGDEFKQFLSYAFNDIGSQDYKYLCEQLLQEGMEHSLGLAAQIFNTLMKKASRLSSKVQPPIAVFMFESLIQVRQGQRDSSIILDKSEYINENRVDISRSFSDILSEDYLKKLINMGANGLINQKQQPKIQKYFYNHWVETDQGNFLVAETQKLQIQLVKHIWMFDFQKALRIGEIIYQKLQLSQLKDEQRNFYGQISCLIPGLQNLNEISQIINKFPLLRLMIEGRSRFDIQFKEDILKSNGVTNLHQISTLHQQFNDLMQLWNFTQEYFEMIQNQLQNPYYRQVASFIHFNRDDKLKTDDDIEYLSKLEQIGIIQRFLYVKKYFSQQNFELFKLQVRSKVQHISQIDYILLFGNKKQSQHILQNYLDETNNIQKVALISVYLKTFSQQARMMSTLRAQQKSYYARFIYVYEWLLDKIDGGISRHQFDKKCLSIQIQRKRKNLTKTFTFNCTNCSAPQIYSILSKKINIDSKQPKLKGYHYFAKDNRSQVMHCIECMVLLPKCSICLYPMSVFNAYAQEMKKNASQKKPTNKGQPINKAIVWCPKCKHGGHFNHIMEWFSQDNRKCPVSNCNCKCSI